MHTADLVSGVLPKMIQIAERGLNHRLILGDIAELKADGETQTLFIIERKAFAEQIGHELPALLAAHPVDYFRTDVGVWVITPVKPQTNKAFTEFHTELVEAWVNANGHRKPSDFATEQFRQYDNLRYENEDVYRRFFALNCQDKLKHFNALKFVLEATSNGRIA